MILVARDEENRAPVTRGRLPVAGNLAAIIDADCPQSRKLRRIGQEPSSLISTSASRTTAWLASVTTPVNPPEVVV
jgi:hypothetical protein